MRSNQSARASPDIWEAEAFSGVGGAADQTPLRWGVAPRLDRVQLPDVPLPSMWGDTLSGDRVGRWC